MTSKVILVTGCSSGFGNGAAKALADQGHTVYASMRGVDAKNERSAAELRAYAASHSVALHVLELDVTSDSSVEEAVSTVIKNAGRIDVAINNAGVMSQGPTEAFTVEQFRQNLDVNSIGPFRVARAVFPHMRQQGEGLLINVTSILGRLTLPSFGIYQASKWALEALSESLRYEASGSGIDVVIVEPGPFNTELTPNAPAPGDTARLEQLKDVQESFEQMMAGFMETFANPEAPTDPKLCVDGILELIATPAGKRPIRTVLGMDFGVNEFNRLTDPIRRGAIGALGFESMDEVRTS